MSVIMDEYNKFMEWFKSEHPALHEKYGRNIEVAFQDGGGVSVTPRFKISKEEQDMLLYVAHGYYDKSQPVLIDTIEFKYADGISVDATGEAAMKNNANMWLSQIVEQINRQEGKVIISFIKPLVNTIGVENVSDDLKKEAKRLVESHGFPFPQ